MQSFHAASRAGLSHLLSYVTRNGGAQVRLPWPRGWFLVLGPLWQDLDFNQSDLSKWEREYTCCPMSFTFVGRIRDTSGERDKNTGMVLLLSKDGGVFCYSGWRDDSIYYLAKDVRDFSVRGLKRVEYLHTKCRTVACDIWRHYARFLYIEKRHWSLTRFAQIVTRNRGRILPMSYPIGSCLRICGLKCFETGAARGILLRLAEKMLGKRCTAFGIVCVKCRGGVSYYGWPKNKIPVVVTEERKVFICNVETCSYIKIASNVTAFVNIGLRNFYENYRFPHRSGVNRYVREPECPRNAFW